MSGLNCLLVTALKMLNTFPTVHFVAFLLKMFDSATTFTFPKVHFFAGFL